MAGMIMGTIVYENMDPERCEDYLVTDPNHPS
jgi:hypothetical protein